MGNRAVIVAHDTNRNNQDKRIGIYLHWCGSEPTVRLFLEEAKKRGVRGVDSDPQYCWARFAQVIGDEFSKQGDNECSLGIGIVKYLDTHNFDNGVYYIDNNFDIVKHTDGDEFEERSKEDDLTLLTREEFIELYGIPQEEYEILQKSYQEN